jgi:hypothetical protein
VVENGSEDITFTCQAVTSNLDVDRTMIHCWVHDNDTGVNIYSPGPVWTPKPTSTQTESVSIFPPGNYSLCLSADYVTKAGFEPPLPPAYCEPI